LFEGEFPDENGNPVAGLWGMVEWTDRAANGIKAKEYSGAVSPVIARNVPDPVTGAVDPIQVFNVGMTNMPFMLDKMPQAGANSAVLTLNSRYMYERFNNQAGGTMDPKQMLADAAAALGLPATATGDEVLGLVKKLVEFVGMLPGAPASPAALPDMGEGMIEDARAAAVNSKALTEVATLLGVDAKDVLAKVGEIRTANTAAPDRAEFDALRKRLAERDADELITANERKINPVDRDFWRNRAVANLADTQALIAKMPDVVPSNKQTAKHTANAADIPDDVVRHYRDQLGTQAIHDKNKENSK
jgi:hypothetical protein